MLGILICSCANQSKTILRPIDAAPFYKRQLPTNTKAIVFIHGFGGNSNTWLNENGNYWPELFEEDEALAKFNIFVFNYPSPTRGQSLTIEELAVKFRGALRDLKVFVNHSEIHLVAHSMGGIVAKSMLIDLESDNNNNADYRKIASVIFLSTPAQGSEMASLLKWLSKNPQMRDLESVDNNSTLQAIENDWARLFRKADSNHYKPIAVGAYEKKSTYGFDVVTRTSATTYLDMDPEAFSLNHFEMAKPVNSSNDGLYVWVRARLLENSSNEDTSDTKKDLTKLKQIIVAVDSSKSRTLIDTSFVPQKESRFVSKARVFIDGAYIGRTSEPIDFEDIKPADNRRRLKLVYEDEEGATWVHETEIEVSSTIVNYQFSAKDFKFRSSNKKLNSQRNAKKYFLLGGGGGVLVTGAAVYLLTREDKKSSVDPIIGDEFPLPPIRP